MNVIMRYVSNENADPKLGLINLCNIDICTSHVPKIGKSHTLNFLINKHARLFFFCLKKINKKNFHHTLILHSINEKKNLYSVLVYSGLLVYYGVQSIYLQMTYKRKDQTEATLHLSKCL